MNQPHKGIGRNDPCPCGSGRKYKQCCLDKDEAAARKSREKAAKAAAKKRDESAEPAAEKPAHPDKKPAPHQPPRSPSEQPWRRSTGNAHPVQRKSLPRKVGGK